jgi:hypothetical protein
VGLEEGIRASHSARAIPHAAVAHAVVATGAAANGPTYRAVLAILLRSVPALSLVNPQMARVLSRLISPMTYWDKWQLSHGGL